MLLAVEVEVSQQHPDTNVGKYWLLARHRQYERVVLIHVYTPAYDSYGWPKTLGAFYAEKMKAEIPFEYVVINCRKATDVNVTLNEVTTNIIAQCKAVFGW
jgi:hypothetical protein